ncbi:MAG TPA: hypothetical protein ENF26_03020 [Methanomicrobia archaeon]|nr:hypothetical protein [Methanomicrobia archaeon]HEX59104.1 hypothetical protein [Methanomicrobia archaeon]
MEWAKWVFWCLTQVPVFTAALAAAVILVGSNLVGVVVGVIAGLVLSDLAEERLLRKVYEPSRRN